MNIKIASPAQELIPMTAPLTPSQSACLARLERLSHATPLVAVSGGGGSGKTTLLQAYQAKHGGHLICREEIIRVVSTVPPERSDSALKAHFDLLLAQHNLILFDNFTDLTENGGIGFPTLGYRSFYFTRFLVPMMHAAVMNAGKRMIMAGRMLAPNGGTVPDPVEFLYGSPHVAVAEIREARVDDYAQVIANVLGSEKAAGINAKRIYDYASHLNCYQLSISSRLLAGIDVPTTEQFIDGLREYFVRANTRTDEVEEVTFDTLPGSEDIVSKLETHVILPLENPELANRLDLKPKRGVLLYGPPGTGKTSIGRALAHRMKGKFFLIDGSVVTDWPGAFFFKVKSIIDEAKACAPSVVFIDDADVLFTIPHIAGLPRYLLSLLDGVESETAGKVCVMMTAMDVGKVPEALLRSGRVELWLETRLPSTQIRAEILKRWMVDDLPESASIDYAALAETTEGRTPADLRRLVSDAKGLYAADRVRGRKPVSATEYLQRSVKLSTTSRDRMNTFLDVPATPSDAGMQVRVESVDSEDFDVNVLQSYLPVLVDFWAPWCGPCQSMAPILDELAPAYAGRMRVVKLNCEENPELANRYGVRSIPRLAVFKDGEIVADQTGALGRQAIEDLIQSVLPEEERHPIQRKAKYALGVGGMAETGVGCKMNGW